MKFCKEDSDFVVNKISDLLEDSDVVSMKNFVQHGNVSTYEHCLNVAIISHKIAKNFAIKEETELLRGAILHDFFLYDWHGKRIGKEGLHCFVHPKKALENAEKMFSLTKKERNIIRSHMFPATIFHFPTCKEAVVVCIADKVCATMETFEIGLLNGLQTFLFQKNIFLQKRG